MARYKLPLETKVSNSTGKEDKTSFQVDFNSPAGSLQSEQAEASIENETLLKRIQTLEEENLRLSTQIQEHNETAKQMGYQEGLRLAEETLQNELFQLKSLHEKVSEEILTAFESIVDHLADIVVEANIKILGRQLIDKKNAMEPIKAILKKVGYQENLQIKLSPNDHELVNKHKLKLSSAKNIEYISDEKIAIGGCIVVTDTGLLDGRLEVQLQALYDVLKRVK